MRYERAAFDAEIFQTGLASQSTLVVTCPLPANPSVKPSQPPAANPQALSLAQRQQALAPNKPVTTATTANASIAPKSGVFAPNTAAAAKPEAWSRQA